MTAWSSRLFPCGSPNSCRGPVSPDRASVGQSRGADNSSSRRTDGSKSCVHRYRRVGCHAGRSSVPYGGDLASGPCPRRHDGPGRAFAVPAASGGGIGSHGGGSPSPPCWGWQGCPWLWSTLARCGILPGPRGSGPRPMPWVPKFWRTLRQPSGHRPAICLKGGLDRLHAQVPDHSERHAQASDLLGICRPTDLGTMLLTTKTVAAKGIRPSFLHKTLHYRTSTLIRPWVTKPPTNSSLSGTTNERRQSVTNLLDEYISLPT